MLKSPPNENSETAIRSIGLLHRLEGSRQWNKIAVPFNNDKRAD